MWKEASGRWYADCADPEDGVLVEMHKYVGALRIENRQLRALVDRAREEYLAEHADGVTDCVTPYDIYI